MSKKPKPDREISAQDVVAGLERLSNLLRSTQHVEGLNPAQWGVLRFLSRANRFSNTVSGLARYSGTTRGTVSQSVQALEKKGLTRSEVRAHDNRSVSLLLTDSGWAFLARDPLLQFEQSFEGLGGKVRKRLTRGVTGMLKAETSRHGVPPFGTCTTCRHLRAAEGERHQPECGAKSESLDAADLTKLCEFYKKTSG
jgi:DNA-binding MarR family transcriptional regulator